MGQLSSILGEKDPTENLTQEEIRELQDTFQLFDDDGSGTIDVDELGQVMKALGQDPTPDELTAMVNDVDKDGSGEIDIDEFIVMMAKRSKGYEKEVKMAFKVFNKDGFITANELRRIYAGIGEELTNSQINELLKKADCDKSGRVNYKQFSTMMKSILESVDSKDQKQSP